MRLLSLEIGADHAGLALRDLLRRRLKLSRSLYRRLWAEDGVRVDGVVPAPFAVLAPGQRLTLDLTDRPSRVEPEHAALSIVYEDEFVAVVDKPAGWVVHPTSGVAGFTLAAGLAARYGSFHLVHRLDRDTSGLLVVARDPWSAQRLSDALSRRALCRSYVAIASREVPVDSGTIRAPIARRPGLALRVVAEDGRPAVTHFEVRHREPAGRTWLDVRLETGRTHQIRVHLAHIGCPLVGDERYGPQPTAWPRLCLHAAEVEIPHPRSGERLKFAAPWPEDLPRRPG